MVKVKNITRRIYKQDIRGKTYFIRPDETIDVTAQVVCWSMIEDKRLHLTFVADDREWMVHRAPETLRRSLVRHFGLSDWHELMDKFFGGSESRRASRLMKKVKIPSIRTPKEPSIKIPKKVVLEKPKEEVVEKKLKPLPPRLDKLTVNNLKELLIERKLPTEGRKADLIKTLTEAE